MTHAPKHDVRGPGAVLSRLLVVLTLVLLGVSQSRPLAMTTAGLGAQIDVELAQGILPEQRHLLRTHPAGDPLPDTLVPDAAIGPLHRASAAAISPALHPFFLPATIHILPPARGPPAV